MQVRAGDIDVVVLDAGDEPVATRPPLRPGPWSAAVIALVAVLVVLGIPVADPEVTDAGPTTAGTTAPDRRRDGCPAPEAERLWCSFVADSPCCPDGADAASSPVSGFRLASSTAGTTVGGAASGAPSSLAKVIVDAARGCGETGGGSALPAQRPVTRRA